MTAFATSDDVIRLKRSLSAEEIAKLNDTDTESGLLSVISDALRVKARQVGKDLDAMVEDDTALKAVAMSVVCDIAVRELDASESAFANIATQTTESAGGISYSYTTPNAGGGLFIKNAELAKLGLRRQIIGAMEMYAPREEA